MKFETAMKRLEEISQKIDSGSDIELEEALALYTEGAAIIQKCNQMLDDAENKINEVNEL